jgi:hypothetical protein
MNLSSSFYDEKDLEGAGNCPMGLEHWEKTWKGEKA